MPEAEAALTATTLGPITDTALNEATGKPAWWFIPSWFVYGGEYLKMPPKAIAFMANRAHAKKTEVVAGVSYVVMVSYRCVASRVIEDAAGNQ